MNEAVFRSIDADEEGIVKMGRYTGPRVKIMRAIGMELPGLSRT